MQLEPGIHDTGFHEFNHRCFDIEDFRIARSYATAKDYIIDMDDYNHTINFRVNTNRSQDLYNANNVVSQAIARWMRG